MQWLSTDTLEDHQVKELKDWDNNTSPGGIMMTSEESFYKKTLLAASLWPQESDGQINYLFGKGIGAEISIRGQVIGREKNNVTFSYRSHSDMELYGVKFERDINSTDTSSKTPYSTQFQQVFGNQEYYPPTATKGLKNLPPDLIEQTAERVNLGEVTLLVPQLELQFLDKFERSESTPRDEGIDAAIIAKQYKLDATLVHQYLDAFVITPAQNEIAREQQDALARQIVAIDRNIGWSLRDLRERNPEATLADAINQLNNEIDFSLGLDVQPSNINGMTTKYWVPLTQDVLTDSAEIDKEILIEKIKGKMACATVERLHTLEKKHVQVDKLLAA